MFTVISLECTDKQIQMKIIHDPINRKVTANVLYIL